MKKDIVTLLTDKKKVVKDGKKLQNKPKMNGNASPKASQPQTSPNNKSSKKQRKRKSDEGVQKSPEPVNDGSPKSKKQKKNKTKSPEVQLGLKIEKLLESPKGADGSADNKKSPGGSKKNKNKNKNKDSPNKESPAPPSKAQQKKKNSKIEKNDSDNSPVKMGNFPTRIVAENAIKALLGKLGKQDKANKLLGDEGVLFVNVDFFKSPQARKLQRIVLQHHIHGNNAEIVFLAADSKTNKADPDTTIEEHRELFKKHGINKMITQVIPWKKLTKEYTQYEEKRKLANSTDVFLIDSRLQRRWPGIMKKKLVKRKAPVPVRMAPTANLKSNFDLSMRKTVAFLKRESRSMAVAFGNTKMPIGHLVDNLVTVGTVFCDDKRYPGGKTNLRSLSVHSHKSPKFPVYKSLESINSVDIPKTKAAKKKGQEVVEGEVTTAGVTVAVHPSGKIKIKSKDKDMQKENNTSPKKAPKKAAAKQEDSDEEDDESDSDDNTDILKGFADANKISDDEDSDAAIEKTEQAFLSELRKQQEALAKGKKAGKKGGNVEEDEDDDDDEEDDEDFILEGDIDDEDDIDIDDEDDDEDDSDDDIPALVPTKKNAPKGKPAKQQSPQQKKKGGKPGQAKGKQQQSPQNGNIKKGKPGKQHQSPKGGARPNKKGGSPQGKNQKGKGGNAKPQARYFNQKAGGKKK